MIKLKCDLMVYGIIYEIHNKINGKWYVGQTKKSNGFNGRYPYKGKGIERVYRYHKSLVGTTHCNNHLLSSIEKYGLEAFEVFEVVDYAFTEEELNQKEKDRIKYRDSFKNGYNRNEGGDSGLYTIKYSDEQIKLVKEMLADINNPLEYIEKITEVPLGYIYQIMKLETRSDIASELNDKILEIRSKDYTKSFMEVNETVITEMYRSGLTKEEILDKFSIAINSRPRIKNRINRLLKLIPYRDKNRTKICPICGKEFPIRERSSNGKKYCGKICREKPKKKKDKERRDKLKKIKKLE